MSLETIHWHTLHAGYLDQNSRVVDLGANYGRFAKAIVERFGCRCIAVEPTPSLFEGMLFDERISKLNLAISSTNGTAEFHISARPTSSSMMTTPNDTKETVIVETRRLDDLVAGLGWSTVDLVKCDIEGAEIDMIRSCWDEFLRSIKQLSIEFHDFCGIVPQAAALETIGRLKKLDFWSVRMSRVGHQDTWLINCDLCDVSTLALLKCRYLTRNWFGFKRVATRAAQRLGAFA